MIFIVLPYYNSEWEDTHIFPNFEETKSYFIKKYLKHLDSCLKKNKYQEFQLRIEEFQQGEEGYVPSYNNYRIKSSVNPYNPENMEGTMDILKDVYDKLKKDNCYIDNILYYHKSSMNF